MRIIIFLVLLAFLASASLELTCPRAVNGPFALVDVSSQAKPDISVSPQPKAIDYTFNGTHQFKLSLNKSDFYIVNVSSGNEMKSCGFIAQIAEKPIQLPDLNPAIAIALIAGLIFLVRNKK